VAAAGLAQHPQEGEIMSNIANIVRVSALSLVFVMAVPAWPASPQLLPPDEVAALLDKAETKDDHLKLAEHYAAEAKQFENEAKGHQALAGKYERPGVTPKLGMQRRGMAKHCQNLAQSLRNAAKASDELAKAHRAMAADVAK
jgi:hypothetical protein